MKTIATIILIYTLAYGGATDTVLKAVSVLSRLSSKYSQTIWTSEANLLKHYAKRVDAWSRGPKTALTDMSIATYRGITRLSYYRVLAHKPDTAIYLDKIRNVLVFLDYKYGRYLIASPINGKVITSLYKAPRSFRAITNKPQQFKRLNTVVFNIAEKGLGTPIPF